MKMKGLIKLGLVALLGLSLVGCGDKKEVNIQYPVDQLFKNHSGYSISYTNSAEQVINKEFRGGDYDIEVFKDVRAGRRGYALIKILPSGILYTGGKVVIHIPRSERIYPGSESYTSGKVTVTENMGEVK